MSIASNSNPHSLRNQACSDETAIKLNDCDPAVCAAYDAAMGKWRPQDADARKFGRPRPPQPRLKDFVAANTAATLPTPTSLARMAMTLRKQLN